MSIAENIKRYQSSLPSGVKLIAVSKTKPVEDLQQAYEAGQRLFGENKALEMRDKHEVLPKDIHWHFIGHLQTNKVSKVVANFDVIHSIDSVKLAEVVSNEAVRQGKVQDVFVQLNNAEEEQKFGFSKKTLMESFNILLSLKGIKILGLMNIAPFEADEQELECLFEDIRQTQLKLSSEFGVEMQNISMGMSNDYHIAVKHGATMLRIGRKLFST